MNSNVEEMAQMGALDSLYDLLHFLLNHSNKKLTETDEISWVTEA